MVPPSAGAVAHGQWCDTCAKKHPGAVFIKKVDVLKHLVEQHSSRGMKATLRKHEARAHHKIGAMQFPVYPLLWYTIASGAREALRSGGKQAQLLAGAPHRQAAGVPDNRFMAAMTAWHQGTQLDFKCFSRICN